LGDSYAFGIAGTGGTSSSSPPAELCTFLVFGVGRRELDNAGVRSWRDEFPNRRELRLELDDKEIPEAYDLRF
jgi:tRNA U34 5-methylaminomethyl-2-thiouridine-forming methyltransferase MnmC